jgi:hypothetical protein
MSRTIASSAEIIMRFALRRIWMLVSTPIEAGS